MTEKPQSVKEKKKKVNLTLKIRDFCKTHIWWRTCIQNKQRTLKTQQLENKQPIRMCKRYEDTSPKRHADGKQA